MASVERTHTRKDTTAATKRPPETTIERLDAPSQQRIPRTAITRRARHHSRSLTPHDLLHLQRTIGNQAVGQILAPSVQRRLIGETKNTSDGSLTNDGESTHLTPEARPSGSGTPADIVVQRQPQNGPGPGAQAVGDVSVHVGTTMTAEAALRVIYDQSAKKITEEALRMISQGTSVEDAARWAVEARNDLKRQIRAKGSPVTKGLAEARNMKKYGNKVGPTYDDLIREGKTPKDIVGSAGEANVKVNRAATRLRVAGRFLIAIDIAIVTWEVIEAPEDERLRTAAGGAGGVAGALAGGWAGAKGGAAVGGFVGAFFGGVGAPIGAAIGGVLGGVGGAIAGGWAGRQGATALYDFTEEIFAPNFDADAAAIDAREDAAIRRASQ